MNGKTISRRRFLKQSAVAAGAAALGTWAPSVSRAAKPQLTVWTIGFFNPKADNIVKAHFQEFAKKANVDVNHVVVSGTQMTRKLQTAVEGGAPPDIAILFDATSQYYISINKLVDVSDILGEMKKEKGGMFPLSVEAVEKDGKAFAIPVALNPWVTHWRKDLLEKAGAADYPKTMDELVEICKKIQKPPYFYGLGLCLGRALDGVDNIQNILWLFDGWMCKDEKTLSIDSPGTIAGLKYINMMYNDVKIIPKGATGWDDGGNNKAYQAKQVAFINNPTSVFSYLAINDRDLMNKTGLSPWPAGPAGSFSLLDTWSYGIFNETKEVKLAKDAVKFVMEPDRYAQLVEGAGGRTVPVYRRLTKTKFWEDRPVFTDFLKMPENGMLIGAKSKVTAAVSEVMTAYIIPDMAQEVVIRGTDPAEAAARAQKRAQEIFSRHYG